MGALRRQEIKQQTIGKTIGELQHALLFSSRMDK